MTCIFTNPENRFETEIDLIEELNPEFLKANRTEVEATLEKLKGISVRVIELNEQFHYKIAVIDNTVFYYGSLNILAHSKSSDSMMAFRMKKTIAQLLRIFGVNKTIKDYENMKNTNSKPSIIQMIGEEIAKNASVEKMCPICKKKLELNYDNDGFYFACSDKVHKEHYKIEIDAVKNAATSLKIKCRNCISGQLILQYARESRPFLGCTQYRKLNCQSKLVYKINIIKVSFRVISNLFWFLVLPTPLLSRRVVCWLAFYVV